MKLIDTLTFFGRLHPLLVHLPIGFLVLAALFDWISYWPRYANLKPAINFSLLLGSISAFLACIFGWMLSWSGDYDTILLNKHMYTGIGLAVISLMFFFLRLPVIHKKIFISQKVLSAGFVLMMGLMSYVGHQGGNMTHGTDYLSLSQLKEPADTLPTTIEEVVVYQDLIEPILQQRCSQCHQEGKIKGELRLKSYGDLLKGGKHGPALVPENLQKSELFRRITLDPKHEEYMPTEGKTPLNSKELAMIEWWILHASSDENIRLTSVNGHEQILVFAQERLGLGDKKSAARVAGINPAIPLKIDSTLIQRAMNKGFEVRILNHQPMMLDVALLQTNSKNGVDLAPLKELSANIVQLNLSGLALLDHQIKALEDLTNLEMLRLERNELTDRSLPLLSKLKWLQVLNIYGNPITKEGLKHLKGHQNLRKIYAWQTLIKPSDLSSTDHDSTQKNIIF